MNLKKFVVLFILSMFLIPLSFVFAEDLEIEEGKTLKFDFEGENTWYNDKKVYDNVNIGAGTQIILGSQWQYVLQSYERSVDPFPENREVAVLGSTDTITVQDEIYITTYTYRNDENIATLSIANTGKITLNAGSELSIRNQYSLITSTQDVSLEYEKIIVNDEEKIFLKQGHLSNQDNLFTYERYLEKEQKIMEYKNKLLKDDEELNIFQGDIVFESGDSDTILSFQDVSKESSKKYVLPIAGDDKKTGTTGLGGYIIDRANITDASVGMPDNDTNIVEMANNFQINSNRAVFYVTGGGSSEDSGEWNTTNRQVKLFKDGGSYLFGNGTIIKQGEGTLNLSYEVDLDGSFVGGVIGTDLTGSNTGYAWKIEQGMVVAHKQDNLGTANMYIDAEGTLGLSIYSLNYSFSPTNIIQNIETGLKTNVFSNNITSSNGEISIAAGSQLELSGNISTREDNKDLRFTFYNQSALVLSGENDAENFVVNFGAKNGGEANYLISDVDGLATKSISVTNTTDGELKKFAFFELVLNENENKEYDGSLQGEMYLHKLGSGIVTLSGKNTYTQGTYISDGGLLLSNSNAIGTGNIWFDRGERGNIDTYASIGVSEITTGDIDLSNNIHIKNGAILNVAENQKLFMLGDIVSYDARPGYETEFVKRGLGEATISGIIDVNRQINISTFTVQNGGFVLDQNIVLNSYFSLDGQDAYLQMNENAGVNNNKVDIYSGDLIIFNENNISSAMAINFLNTNTSTESFSKLHVTSDTNITLDNISSEINIETNINFVVDSTLTARLDKFNFKAGNDAEIVKSGEGIFVAVNGSEAEGKKDFAIGGLYVTDGTLDLKYTNMKVSGTTLIDGGMLVIEDNSKFTSTAASAEDKRITILSGGIKIYDDNSVDNDTKLYFDGTDEDNLAKLIIEAENVSLSNDIYVKAGINIENEKALTFSGDQITFDPDYAGILAKSGAGTMTIDTVQTFEMGQIMALEGDLIIKSNIDVSTMSVLGESALLVFDNVENAEIDESLVLAEGGVLSVLNSNLYIGRVSLDSATVTNTSSVINVSEDLQIDNTNISLLGDGAEINAGDDISFSTSSIEFTATSAKLSSNKNITIESSTFSLSGENSSVIAGENINFSTSAIEFSEASAKLNAGKDINIDDSNLSMSGENSEVKAEENISVSISTISFSEASAKLNAGKDINIDDSNLSMSGENSEVKAEENISISTSTISFAEAAAKLNAGKNIDVKGSNLSMSGENSEVKAEENISIGTSTISFAEAAAKLNAGKEINIKDSNLSMAGANSEITSEEDMVLSTSTISFAEAAAKMSSNKNISIESSTISMLGENSGVTAEENISISTSTINFAEATAKLNSNKNINIEKSNVSMSGANSEITAGEDIVLSTSTISFAETTAKLSSNKNITIESSTISMLGENSGVTAEESIIVSSSSITFEEATAKLNSNKNINIENSNILMSGENSEITAKDNIVVSSNSSIVFEEATAKMSSDKSINIEGTSLSMLGANSEITAEEDIIVSSSAIIFEEATAKLNSNKNINIDNSYLSMFGADSDIIAGEDIKFYDSLIDFSADSIGMNSNNINLNNSKINISSESVLINAINNIELNNSEINLSTGSGITATNINLDTSKLVFSTSSAHIDATVINLNNESALEAFGAVNSNINVRKGSYIKIGKDDSVDNLKTKNVVFESGTALFMDVSSENGVASSDKLEVSGDITVQKDVKLYVNVIGNEYNTSKEFEFLTFTGQYDFANTTNEIFDIFLSDLRFSASTILRNNSIFLKVGKDWESYNIPGVTKNQKSMIDVFNEIRNDDFGSTEMKSTINTLNSYYSDYIDKGNKTQFINALQDLSGIFYANSFMTSAMLSKANIIYNRLNDFSKEREENNKVWTQVYTNNFSVSENDENPKFENNMYGMIAGYDTISEDNFIFGIAGFYGQGELKQLKDKADLIDVGANIYGDYKINEKIKVKGLIGYSMQDYDTTRTIRFINKEIKSKYATNTINVDLEASYMHALSDNLSLKPIVGANCAVVSNGDIEEDGNLEQKLKIEKDSYTKAEVKVGVGLQTRSESPFNWYVSAAIKQIVIGDKFTTKSYFVKVPDYEFEIESTKLANTSFVGNLGCSYDISSSFNVSLDLSADTGSASGFGANVGATYRW